MFSLRVLPVSKSVRRSDAVSVCLGDRVLRITGFSASEPRDFTCDSSVGLPDTPRRNRSSFCASVSKIELTRKMNASLPSDLVGIIAIYSAWESLIKLTTIATDLVPGLYRSALWKYSAQYQTQGLLVDPAVGPVN